MSADPQDVRALARAFAVHLEHLRRFRGVHYVGADALGHADVDEVDEVDDAPAVEAVEAEPPREPAAIEPAVIEAQAAAPARVEAPPSPAPSPPPPTPAAKSASEWSAARKLDYLRERNIGNCQRCPLARTRRNIVFGVGDPEADLMFVGEAPGADEDRLGEPFVGAAGRRLDQWIEQLGLRRDQVYIANVLKCRPPNNRDPRPEEIERCSPFLHAQLRAIEPKVIVALGRFAGNLLLGGDYKLHEMRRQDHVYREPKSGAEIPLVVTYHPSYVIRRERESGPDRGAAAKTDRGGAIKSEDQKVLDDLRRALARLRR